jgi:hypothetical protein
MQYVDSNGNFLTLAQLRAQFNYVSFPPNPVQKDVEFIGCSYVVPQPCPAVKNGFYLISEGTPQQVDGVWTQTWDVTPWDLASAQRQQNLNLSAACARALIAGYTSSALGSTYSYPSQLTDQQNLHQAVVSSILPGIAETWTMHLWCADATGNWAMLEHTASQIQQVAADWLTNKSSIQANYAAYVAQVAQAQDVDAVAAITWPA